MKPVLYSTSETAFTTNGLGVLADCISCLVTEERNGDYELEMEYPSVGLWAEDIDVGCIIKARANDNDEPQLFVIYDVIRNLTGIYTIKAEHISYRLSGYPVKPFSAAGPAAALEAIPSNVIVPTGFSFSTDLTSTTAFSFAEPRSVKALLGGEEGSILDSFNGEYHFDNFSVELLRSRGADNGVTIRYGKNLTDLEQDINGAVYNGIYPYWYSESEGAVYPDSAVEAEGGFAVPCYEVKDLSSEFKEKPTKAQLTARAEQLVSGMGSPVESIDISFVSLSKLQEYDAVSALETVSLCDTIHVIYEALGIDVRMKVVKCVYNVLTEMYESLTVGELQTSLADAISSTASSGGAAGTDTTYGLSISGSSITLSGSDGSRSTVTVPSDYAPASHVTDYTNPHHVTAEQTGTIEELSAEEVDTLTPL